MPNYRRMRVPGGTYFFMVRLAHPRSTALIPAIGAVRDAMRIEQAQHPFEIIETVVLPDHLHAIWRLPGGDSDFSAGWSRIKSRVTKTRAPIPTESASKRAKREAGLWQRRFWERNIRCDQELSHYRA